MSEDDPFENLDPPEDREGDPFEGLGDGMDDDEQEAPDGSQESESRGEQRGDEGETHDGRSDSSSDDDGADSFWEEIQGADRIGAATSTESSSAEEATTDPAVEETRETEIGAGQESPFEEAFVEGDTVGSGDAAASGEADDPFAGLGDPGGDPFGEGESAFEQVDMETLDADELWALLDEDPDATPSASDRPVTVSKHRFCEQCEFFSEPPNAHCMHDEAEILEYIGIGQVRVVDCPVVAEQRRLENEE